MTYICPICQRGACLIDCWDYELEFCQSCADVWRQSEEAVRGGLRLFGPAFPSDNAGDGPPSLSNEAQPLDPQMSDGFSDDFQNMTLHESQGEPPGSTGPGAESAPGEEGRRDDAARGSEDVPVRSKDPGMVEVCCACSRDLKELPQEECEHCRKTGLDVLWCVPCYYSHHAELEDVREPKKKVPRLWDDVARVQRPLQRHPRTGTADWPVPGLTLAQVRGMTRHPLLAEDIYRHGKVQYVGVAEREINCCKGDVFVHTTAGDCCLFQEYAVESLAGMTVYKVEILEDLGTPINEDGIRQTTTCTCAGWIMNGGICEHAGAALLSRVDSEVLESGEDPRMAVDSQPSAGAGPMLPYPDYEGMPGPREEHPPPDPDDPADQCWRDTDDAGFGGLHGMD